jgi:hypothetical protein
MCKAFSLLVTKSKKVYWKVGLDSHDELQDLFKSKDRELVDDKKPPDNTFARIEIVPKDDNYLKPKPKWKYIIDEQVKPNWINKSYEKPCYEALKKWQDKIYSQVNVKEALNPIYPFKIKPPEKITKRHIEAVKLWASVWDSVGDPVRDPVWASVWDSVGDSVGDSVWDSVRDPVRDPVFGSVWDPVWDSVWASVWALVWASVRDSVWASVRASVGAYMGTLFPKVKEWKYIDYRKKPFNKMKGKYPFYPAVYLWKRGLVPSFGGEKWRLHGYKDARVLWEGKINSK